MNTNLNYNEVNKIPFLTWNWLKMNRAPLRADVAAERTVSSRIEAPDGVRVVTDAAEFAALASKLPAFKTDLTADARDAAARFVAETVALVARAGAPQTVTIHIDAAAGGTAAARQLVIAESGADITIIEDYTSPHGAGGFALVQTVLHAQPGARIHLVKAQLLGADFVHIDGTNALAEDGARIEVTQLELGGAHVYADTLCTLAGDRASFKSDTAYLCTGAQSLDLNALTVHTGTHTDTQMNVHGVVGGSARKTYRGTIDFRHGCAGATGDEQEETLLLSPTAVNKSIPMILCDEEDVAGTHGATLGRLGADELFYFQSRGISEEEAEKIITRAKVQRVAALIPDSALRERISAFIGDTGAGAD